MLSLISENINNIIIDSDVRFITYVMKTINEHIRDCSDKDDERIKKIDYALAQNIEYLLNIKYSNSDRYNFEWFDKMELFKQEISKIGVKFFIKFPIVRPTLEQCKAISEELFGIFDEETFSTIRYGRNDKTKAIIIETIIKELMKASDGEVSIKDLRTAGGGHYSEVFQVGDYVLKIGSARNNCKMPNHRRILQPIVRAEIPNEDGVQRDSKNNYIEVQNVVDTDWWESMSESEIDNILHEIYRDLRAKGYIWLDIKKENVGRLRKENRPNLTFIDTDGKVKDIRPTGEATGLIGKIPEDEILKKGDYVIVDTDWIVSLSEYENNQERPITDLTLEYEKDYLKNEVQKSKKSSDPEL